MREGDNERLEHLIEEAVWYGTVCAVMTHQVVNKHAAKPVWPRTADS